VFAVGGILGRAHNLGRTCGADANYRLGWQTEQQQQQQKIVMALNSRRLIFQMQQSTKIMPV
jgi:hypothetical protein